ncbi:hypothetical protein AC622_09175 [Bacillus sp. FJAT-27916]|uniref:DUF6438 domain-containing protein n=1 Tax=Bacillaceae TaxID=186817 RepID=UPI0006714CD2|nr:DUF6438 domain-containing protein [Bacillus sp. FJAT-27916]KMY44397.1 hypothetical protein AC622_09175 [Bacillus sp. FJAT-27916]
MFKEISISRTSCIGNSPIYQSTIQSDGRVFWNGEKNVSFLGEHKFTISSPRLKKLEDLLLSFDYKNFTYHSSREIIPDSPTCVTRVVFKHGETKTVVHDLGDVDGMIENKKHTLKKLERFERDLERIAGLKTLIKQPLYLYHFKNKHMENVEYVLSSPSQEEAFKLIDATYVQCKNWEIEKLGRDSTHHLHPYIVMQKDD